MDEKSLIDYFKERLQHEVPLAKLTAARVGGPARYFVPAQSAAQLAVDVQFLWAENIPFFLLGTGSNILVSDAGLDAVVVHNQARLITVDHDSPIPSITAESGAILATVARQAAVHNLTGLEWASTIPGTIGGAVYGNAGAHGSDMQHNLILADILHRTKGYLSLSCEQMGYSYRSSVLKREPGEAIILSARLAAQKGDEDKIRYLMNQNTEKRRSTQPSGSSTGSTFKNPEGDSAGRLIEEAGLKGTRIGGVEVNPLHANFFSNDGTGTARDYYDLILLVQKTVLEKTGKKLELEIEIIGDWQV